MPAANGPAMLEPISKTKMSTLMPFIFTSSFCLLVKTIDIDLMVDCKMASYNQIVSENFHRAVAKMFHRRLFRTD